VTKPESERDGILWPKLKSINDTQALKQTLPPNDSDAYTARQLVFDFKYLSCKISFNVLNYVFISLFIFNFYRLVNISNQQSRETVVGTSASITVSSVTTLNSTF